MMYLSWSHSHMLGSKLDPQFTANQCSVYFLEKIILLLLGLAAINFLLVLLPNGYKVSLGPLHFSVSRLHAPVLLFLSLAIVTSWWQGQQRGIPAHLRLRSSWLLFLGVVFIYSLNGRALTSGDTIPASYLPLSLLREFDFDLDEFPFLYAGEMPWFLQRINGHVVSAYPPWAGVLAVPVYLLPVLAGVSPQAAMIHDLEKLSATLITALSVILLLWTLRRLTSEGIAWSVAIVYAFGTSSFSSSSQALWQHGPSQLFLTLTIYWLVKGRDQPKFSAYAGLALGSAIICRPSNAFIVIPIAAYVLLRHRDQIIGFCLAALPPFLGFVTYNTIYNGSPLSIGFPGGNIDPLRLISVGAYMFQTPLYEGLAGVLVSPGRGLFVYSPIFLVSVVGIAMIWWQPEQVLLKCLSFAPVTIILLTSKWAVWWGGGSYGPRLLADITAILSLYLYLPFERARSRWFLKGVIAGLVVLSISLHALRVFGDGDWNGYPNVDRHPERLWSWVDSPPIYYTKPLIMDAFAKLQRRLFSFPTSRDAPHKLAASYHLISLSPEGTLAPKSFLTVRVRVVNTGEAVWLNRSQGEKGEVRLQWRWLKEQQEVSSTAGGLLIGYDVLPGRTYDFTTEVTVPGEPGEYLLELGLIDMHVTSFAEQGVAPLEIALRVASL
jgi:Dolichyl-phosphate-mannose-protein mannosyltransferase